VYSPYWTEHLQHLEVVLQVLKQHQLYAKLSKCSFGLQQVDYLGHTVSGQGVAMEADKVQAVLQWPCPTNVKQLRGFLGLTGYYRRFIKGYASIASPLTDLLKKDQFQWSSQATETFQTLKLAITQAPVLALPDFTKPFVLETDASGTGIGAILSQNNHPIVFFSKKLTPRMQKQSAYAREFYAITEAIGKFRHYLLGHKFIIRTDQKSLRSLTDQAIQTSEQQKWLHKLLGYDFSIEYKPGKDNVGADALSRSFLVAWSQPQLNITNLVRKAVNEDTKLRAIMEACIEDKPPHPNYSVQEGILFWKSRIVLPPNHSIVKMVLHEFHDTPLGGHAGVTRTLSRLAAQFYWEGMQKDVKNHVQCCLICQQAKVDNTLPAGLLQPLPIPKQIWEDVAMDFITALPPSQGFTVIMVVIDRLSKYAHFATLRSDYNSKQVAEIFVKNIIRLHGFPKTIVSDRDKVFTSQFWQHLFKLSGTTLNLSTAYHPQSDGQSEILNKCLELYLRCFTHGNPKDWVKFLPWVEYWYNTSYHHNSDMTPFKVVYGRDPPTLIKYSLDSKDPPSIQEQLIMRDLMIEKLKQNLNRAQQYMKKYADQKRRQMELQVGDMVLVKLQPYRQNSVALRKNQKLGLKYFGPFPVIHKVGAVAYKLLLPQEAKIHPVFHISQLKVCKGDHSKPYIPLPLSSTAQPAATLSTRTILRGHQQVKQFLIQWEGNDEDHATWEDEALMQQAFPSFNLEDKVSFKRGGNVTSVLGSKDDFRGIGIAGPSTTGPNEETIENEGKRLGRGARTKITNSRLADFDWCIN